MSKVFKFLIFVQIFEMLRDYFQFIFLHIHVRSYSHTHSCRPEHLKLHRVTYKYNYKIILIYTKSV